MLQKKTEITQIDFQEFIYKLKEKDAKAWSRLDFILKRILLKWMVKKGVLKADVMEIYNDTLTVFLEKFEKLDFDSFSGMKSYIFSIADKKIKEFWRKSARQNRNTSLEKIPEQNYTDFISLFDKEEEIETRKKINTALECLSKQERTILTLFYNEGQHPDDIAKYTKLSHANVRVIKHRALKKIRSEILK